MNLKSISLFFCLATLAATPIYPLTEPNPLAEPNPDSAYGFTWLPSLWNAAENYPITTKALIFGSGLTSIFGGIYGLKNDPQATGMALATGLALSCSGWTLANTQEPDRHWWQWDAASITEAMKAENLIFPVGFMFGTGTSSYQVEGVGPDNGGVDTSTYAPGYLNHTLPEPVGLACNQWNIYEGDAKLMAEKGFNTYRFSVERFKVEPTKGQFNKAALDHYAAMARTLIENNVRPLVGMHHYTDPQWFMNDGGFENEKNLDGFATYCAKITGVIYEACMTEINKDFDSKKHLIPLFYTYNSSNAYAATGYQQGTRPPYIKDMQRFANVLGNMLEAHVLAYNAMKAVAPLSKIGTTINLYQLDASDYRNPAHRLKCFFGNHMMHDAIFNFFKDGVFKLWIPTKAYIHKTNKKARESLDWVGLNYYSHAYMDTMSGPFSKPEDGGEATVTPKTNHPIYAEGLYRALHEINDQVAKPLDIPIIITETGIGVGDDHAKRKRYLERYLYATSKAWQAGIPVIGIMIWSFMDNYEWGNYTDRYGLFAVDFNTQARTWRTGSQHYVDVIQKARKGHPAVSI